MAGLEEAAAAFDAIISDAPPKTSKAQSSEGPPEHMFKNVGRLDDDTEARGGGDDDEDQDSRSKADPRNPREREREDREGDDDEPDESGDDGDGEREGEEEEEGDDEGSEGSEKSALLETKVEVTVDGEPVEVSIKEALEGYIRTETFHRRMNQLDEAKKIVRRAAGDAVHNYEYATNLAKQMQAHMEQMIPKEPNWDEEFAKDPNKARDLQKYYEKAKQFQAHLRGQIEDAHRKQLESNAVQVQAFAEEENSKFEQMNRKHWSDPKRKAKDLNSMRRTGLSMGFTEDELSQVYDSRMLMVLLKASKYDRMMASKPKPVVRSTGKPIPPGTGSAKQRSAQKGVTSAMKRLNRTGSVEDAAVVFDQLIARG